MGERIFSSEERELLLKKVDEKIKVIGSAKKVGKVLGVSDVILSGLRSNKYKGDVDKQYATLEAYFLAEEQALTLHQPLSYVDISISEDLYERIRNCQLKGGLAVACGDAGIGKTKACKKYVEDNPSMAIYIALNPCISTIKPILKILSKKLNVTEKTNDDMWLSISNKLSDKMVIIIDEAQHLTIKTIESLRAFCDYFEDIGQSLGIIFVGNINTVNNFNGTKKAEFHQIANRTKQPKTYYTTQIKKSDIEKLFPLLCGKENELEFLHQVAKSKQAIRGAMNLFSNAYDNENITYEGLVAMAKHMEMRV